MKKYVIFAMVCFVSFKLLAIFGGDQHESTVVIPSQMTAESYAKQFNKAAKRFGSTYQIASLDIVRDDNMVMHKTTLDDYAVLALQKQKNAQYLNKIMLVNMIDNHNADSPKAGVDATIVAAALNPTAPTETLTKSIGKLVYDAVHNKPALQTLMLNGVKYTASVGENGMIFSLDL